MNLSDLNVLLIEDNVYKGIDVTRALEYCGVRNICSVRNQEAGFEKIYEGREKGSPINLIVTDMHYPLGYGMESDPEAGFKLIERLKKEELDILVIICSTHNFSDPNILGSVWYSELCDLNRDFKEVLGRLER